MQCRFGGHCADFWSVAQHSVCVSRIVPPEDALAGLLHDAAEAYLVDLPRPIKRFMPTYRAAEQRIARVIGQRFSVELVELPAPVKHADEVMLATEKRDLMLNSYRDWGPLPEPLAERLVPRSPMLAKADFLERLSELLVAREVRGTADTLPPGRPELPTLTEGS
jgi:5'-deoxynucleotidase YfbR-like HD superfamily hydrolase